jgi:hypothetical protein
MRTMENSLKTARGMNVFMLISSSGVSYSYVLLQYLQCANNNENNEDPEGRAKRHTGHTRGAGAGAGRN